MQLSNNYSYALSFHGRNNQQPKMKKIVDEDKYDEFVNAAIRKEKENSDGVIYYYRDFLTSSERKNFSKDLQGALGHYVINNNLHIIKHGNQDNTFVDNVKEIPWIKNSSKKNDSEKSN